MTDGMLKELVRGDTLEFRTSVPEYPPSQGWLLRYRLVPRAGGQAVLIEAASEPDADCYVVQVQPAITANWVEGAYGWASWVEKAGARQTLERGGDFRVLPDPAQVAPGTDLRTDAERALAECEAALLQFSTSGGRVKSYAIAGRQMEFETSADLQALVRYWKQRVYDEREARRCAEGKKSQRNIQVVFR